MDIMKMVKIDYSLTLWKRLCIYAEKQFILIDECKSVGGWGEKSNLVNDLKKVATETRIQQRRLYTDYQIIETQTCYIVFTNEPDALNMDKEDERYMVIKNENDNDVRRNRNQKHNPAGHALTGHEIARNGPYSPGSTKLFGRKSYCAASAVWLQPRIHQAPAS